MYIGVPGRIVKNSLTEDQKQKQKLAQSVGFDAYGTSSETLDPVATAIHGLIEHIHIMDKRVDSLCQTIHKMGGEIPDVKMPDLTDCDLEPEIENQLDDKKKKL